PRATARPSSFTPPTAGRPRAAWPSTTPSWCRSFSGCGPARSWPSRNRAQRGSSGLGAVRRPGDADELVCLGQGQAGVGVLHAFGGLIGAVTGGEILAHRVAAGHRVDGVRVGDADLLECAEE